MSIELRVRSGRGRWRNATRDEVLDAAAQYLVAENRGQTLHAPIEAVGALRPVVCGRSHETLAVMFLDTRHRVLEIDAMFRGTVDGATVYVREIARRALELGAAAVILAHNHPSGDPEPSMSDRTITTKVARGLALLEIRLLDHLVLTNVAHVSLSERGWLV